MSSAAAASALRHPACQSPPIRTTMSRPSSAAPSSSASTIIASATSGYHVLKIEGYSFTKSVPNGKHIQSRTFRVAGHSWFIKYFPNGDRKEAADYVSFYLVLMDRVTDALMVHLSFSFIDQVDYQKPSYVRGLQASCFLTSPTSFGRMKFIKRDDLERSGRLKDDCFTVRCDIIVVGKIQAVHAAVVPSSAPAALVVPPPDWPQHFRALLESGQGADVRFLVDGKIGRVQEPVAFHIHRLAATGDDGGGARRRWRLVDGAASVGSCRHVRHGAAQGDL